MCSGTYFIYFLIGSIDGKNGFFRENAQWKAITAIRMDSAVHLVLEMKCPTERAHTTTEVLGRTTEEWGLLEVHTVHRDTDACWATFVANHKNSVQKINFIYYQIIHFIKNRKSTTTKTIHASIISVGLTRITFSL